MILECAGCHTLSFRNTYAVAYSAKRNRKRNLISGSMDKIYPPASERRRLSLLPMMRLEHRDVFNIVRIYKEVCDAYGSENLFLAAYGARTLIDIVVSTEAGDRGTFPEKLKRLLTEGRISQYMATTSSAAFDAGSATAHRGYRPSREDTSLLIDAAEALLKHFYLDPQQLADQAEKAGEMSKRIPPRTRKSCEIPPQKPEESNAPKRLAHQDTTASKK